MFNCLRQNSTVYIFEKGENPSLKIGQVDSISQPRPKFNSMYNPLSSETVIDIKVRTGEETLDFQNLPTNNAVATYGNTIITDSKDTMNEEIEGIMRTSKQIVESAPYHQKVVQSCEGILQSLNPQLAKEKEREDRLDSMESKLNKMFEMFQQMNTKSI